MTPVGALIGISQYRMGKFSPIDKAFSFWAAMVVLCCLMLLFYDPLSLLTFEFVLKLAMPVYLYFFLRVFITELKDLHGLLQSFLYAGIFIAVLLIYEVFINPIAIQESRGLERIQASFGDVVSYGMYIVFATITAAYFYFSRQHISPLKDRMKLLAIVVALGLLGILNIHHTATYIVFVSLVGLFVLFNLRTQNKGVGAMLIVVIGLGLSLWGSQLIEERISPLVETDLAVYAGEQDTDKLLHGRVGRWRMMLQMFSSEDVQVQFFGFPLKFEYVYQYIGIGSHNDFVRMLFATGIFGLAFYLVFLFRVYQRSNYVGMAQKFLILALLFALSFYSISVTPTYYAPFMYFALAIIAYASLPDSKLHLWNGRAY